MGIDFEELTPRSRRRRPWTALLTGAALSVSCASGPQFSTAELGPLSRNEPIADEVVGRAVKAEPNDATLTRLQEAFSLLRHASSDDDVARARDHLESAFATFEDLRDPENMSVAFTVDGDTPYRGRPHERVLAATTLALTDAAKGRCDLALPTLKAAEFLDVRWQKLAFGTDAAVVYALSLYCLHQTNGRVEDITRAETGLRLTLRYTAAAEAARVLVKDATLAAPRADAVAVQLARELAELGVLTALANAAAATTSAEILKAGLDNTAVVIRRAGDLLQSEAFASQLEVARAASGGTIGADTAAARSFVRRQLKPALDDLATAMKAMPVNVGAAADFVAALQRAEAATDNAMRALRGPRAQFTFAGLGPEIVREGDYLEVARVVPRAGVDNSIALRMAAASSSTSCGIRGSADGSSFTAVLCGKSAEASSSSSSSPVVGMEVWSSSTQATTVVGRRFDAILQGRATFKASSEAISTVAAYSAWGLLDAGFELLASCAGGSPPSSSEEKPKSKSKSKSNKPAKSSSSSGSGDSVCVGIATTTIVAGAVVGGIGGIAWIAGAAVNPASDPRFVSALPEQVVLVVPGDVVIAPAAAMESP